jgi:hypothetical protein
LQLSADAKATVLVEKQIVKHVEVKVQDELGFAAGVREFGIGKSPSDGKKMIGDALHGGDDYGDAGCLRGGANEACGMEHTAGTEERTAAKLEGDDVPGLFRYPAGAMHAMVQRGRAWFRC